MQTLHPPAVSTPLLFSAAKTAPPKPAKRELTQEENEELQFAFDSMDYEKTGSITPSQLKVALRAMGFPVKKAEVRELLRRHGEDEDLPRMDFSVFRRLVADKMSERTPQDEMMRAFQLFDVHGMGKLDLGSMRKVVKSLGLDIQEAELQDMIDEFDQDKDGCINQEEFMSMLMLGDDL